MDDVAALARQHSVRGEYEAAEEILGAAVTEDPDNAELRSAYADCLAMQLFFERAIEQSLRTLHPAPGAKVAPVMRVTAVNRMARCAVQIGAPSIVLPYLDSLNLSSFQNPVDRCWHPRILAQAGFLEEARFEVSKLIDIFPDNLLCRYVLGEIKMSLGERDGIPLNMLFSSRAFMQVHFPDMSHFERLWEGEPLDGKSIAIVPWGGHGDCFQFISHVRQLKQLGARHVTGIAASRYRELLLSSGVDEVVAVADFAEAQERSDYWVTTFGLPRAEKDGAGERRTSGYLTPPPSETADAILASAKERAAGRPCLGLYWYSDQMLGDTKSIPLSMLIPLFARKDVHWVVLQGGFGLRRMRAVGLGAEATIPDDQLPFDDAGALIRGLDGMVSICAWPFHLAGAVGTRTWLLAGRVMSTRHLGEERDSVIYPGCATLARQPRAGDWAGAIARLNEELDAFVAEFARREPGPATP